MKCYINIDGMRYTQTGKRKKWSTDGVITYCCEFTPSIYIWEKNTKYNNYNGYSGYINKKYVELIK